MIQDILVWLIGTGALVYLYRRFAGSNKSSCGSGCSGCQVDFDTVKQQIDNK